jgi:two-component system sensor histidine kinase DegS
LFDRDQETAKEELVNLKDSASLTFQRVRDFISDLRPMMLDDLGLIPTVRRYLESFSNKSDIGVTENIVGQEDRRLEEYQEVMLFRGLQDLMAHARDFADATEIDVRLDVSSDDATVTVEDNGRSFDAEEALADEHPDDPRAQGILTLRERFEVVQGEVAVISGEGERTQVRITMPVTDRIE